MEDKVSIVVTCYNYGDYVHGCLESISRQTHENYEVIIIDDGSTDNSAEVIRPFLADRRFNYIKQLNSGQTKAKNRGILESTGNYIAFLDADDIWSTEKLEEQLALFTDPKVGVVYSMTDYIDENNTVLETEEPGEYLLPRRNTVTRYLLYDNFVPFSSVIVKRECFDRLGRFDESLTMGIDWDLWLRFSTEYSFDFVEKPLMQYRVGHSGQMSKKILERFECADQIASKFLDGHADVITKKEKKDVLYYTYCLRGYSLRGYGLITSLQYYMRAIALYPYRGKAYLGMVKTLVKQLVN